MGVYKHLRTQWKKPSAEVKALWRQRLISWRKQPVSLRVQRPTRLDRARALGYKAKPGFVIVRQRANRGGHSRPSYLGGKRSKRMSKKLPLRVNYQRICEERANKNHKNCEVLGSYYVARDGKNIWYEVILLDRSHPAVTKDPRFKWVASPANRARAARGLTSAGRKGRGLRAKGKGGEKRLRR